MSGGGLGEALACLESMGPRLVVVGGTAHRVFPRHPRGRDPGFALLTTQDVDVAAALELHADGSLDLREKLQQAGFRELAEGVDYPAYSYRPTGDGQIYLQFIAPRIGSGRKRDGTLDRILRFSGIHAERLPHVDVLLHQPWLTDVSGESPAVRLWVVNPVAYLVQKLLVFEQRRDKRAKDLLYVFDTLAIFGDSLADLGAEAAGLVPEPSRSALNTLRFAARERCFRESGLSHDAAAIAASQRARPPSSAQIVAACRAGLPRILASLVPDL